MNDKCKYCDYVSKCSRICEYNSYLCKVHRSFPKVVDKSYEQLQQENKKLNGAIQTYDILLKVNGEENKQLKIQISAREEVCNRLENNWNKLKEYIDIKLYNVEYLQKLCGCRIDDETHMILDIIKKEMKELEQGSDSK